MNANQNCEIKKGFVYLPPLDPIRQNEYFCPVRPDDEPIDVVYTWVNGSDPQFIESIQSLKTKKETSSRRFYGKKVFNCSFNRCYCDTVILKWIFRNGSTEIFNKKCRNVRTMGQKYLYRHQRAGKLYKNPYFTTNFLFGWTA